MAFPIFLKDPQAILDYGFDWTDWLDEHETISSVVWTVPSGITKVSQVESGAEALIWLSGGTAGNSYDVVCHIVTSDAREDDRTMTIKVQQR